MTSAGTGRDAPSSVFSASTRPSGSAAAKLPSAPGFATSPGTARIRWVASMPVPATNHGCARIAVATRCSGLPACAVAMRA